MSDKMKLILKCDEANHVCNKTQYDDATLWDKIKLNIHLAYCRSCRNYKKNNTKLTKTIKKAHIKCLDKKSKENMREELEKLIKQNPIN